MKDLPPYDPDAGELVGPATGVPLYTLDEARVELARQACRTEGHDWTMHTVRTADAPGDRPVAIGCERPCGHPGFDVVERRELENLEPQLGAGVDG